MKRWIIAAVITSLVAAAGCGRGERPVPAATEAFDDSTPRPGGTLFRRLESDVATLNPVQVTSRTDRLVVEYLFTPVIQLDSNLMPIPGLAESWDISSDGRQYTFKLSEKATFSDGRPVRASDVLFTLRKIVDPQSDAAQIATNFDQVDLSRSKVVDDHTLVVTLREPLAPQLISFNDVLVLPEHVYGKGDFKKDFTSAAIGSGPYVLVRREPGKEVVVQRRKDYWGEQPHVDTVVFKVITSSTTAWNAVRVGDVDETMVQSDIWLREHADPALLKKLDFPRFYSLSYNYIGWNAQNPLFADKRARRALSMCVDVKSIITNLYGGTARAVTGPFVPDQWAFNPDVPSLEYNPDAAKQIFTSLGWLDTNKDGVIDKGGKPFKFDMMIISGSGSATAIAQMLQSTLKTIGVEMNIVVVDSTIAIQRTIYTSNYDAIYMSWDLTPDPDLYPVFHSSQIPPHGQNYVFYNNREADRLIVEARRELNQSKRAALYKQLHVIIADDQPYTWISQPSLKWAVNRRVKNVKPSTGLGLFSWYPAEFDWWIAAPPRTGT